MHLNTEIDMKLGCHCKEHNNQQAVRLAKIVKAVVHCYFLRFALSELHGLIL